MERKITIHFLYPAASDVHCNRPIQCGSRQNCQRHSEYVYDVPN